jgi:hypothetical protein
MLEQPRHRFCTGINVTRQLIGVDIGAAPRLGLGQRCSVICPLARGFGRFRKPLIERIKC